MTANPPAEGALAPFSEKSFYLAEFRGRTLALAAATRELRAPAALEEVLKELEANATRVILLAPEAPALRAVLGTQVLRAGGERLEGAVWRALQSAPRVGIAVAPAADLARACREIALRLRVPKLVWIDRAGGLLRPDGTRLSFVDLGELRELLSGGLPRAAARRLALLREIERALEGGLPAVNLCTLEGLADELFSYAGSGTLFTRDRYVEVRRLGIDDFDAASDLIARGVEEGYLAPRQPHEVEEILGQGFGAFVEGRHLAGIGALRVHAQAGAAEIASLYTLTRFLGEGVGAHLVRFALERARRLGLGFAFACTTSERVAEFFERQGFARVAAEGLPTEKWQGYDPERRLRLHCLRRELSL
jgi:N-acetylglutamate synthase-like GNAT family acetyltransferase